MKKFRILVLVVLVIPFIASCATGIKELSSEVNEYYNNVSWRLDLIEDRLPEPKKEEGKPSGALEKKTIKPVPAVKSEDTTVVVSRKEATPASAEVTVVEKKAEKPATKPNSLVERVVALEKRADENDKWNARQDWQIRNLSDEIADAKRTCPDCVTLLKTKPWPNGVPTLPKFEDSDDESKKMEKIQAAAKKTKIPTDIQEGLDRLVEHLNEGGSVSREVVGMASPVGETEEEVLRGYMRGYICATYVVKQMGAGEEVSGTGHKWADHFEVTGEVPKDYKQMSRARRVLFALEY